MPTDATFLELLASYETALELASRANRIVWGLADAQLAGCHLPPAVLREYVEQAADAQRRVQQLQGMVAEYRRQVRLQ